MFSYQTLEKLILLCYFIMEVLWKTNECKQDKNLSLLHLHTHSSPPPLGLEQSFSSSKGS